MVQRGPVITLYGHDGAVLTGGLKAVEDYVANRLEVRGPGPPRAVTPALWRPAIDAYALHLVAAGHSPATVESRCKALARIGRELRCAPADVTAEMLVGWLGRHRHWAPETRRDYRSAARGFLRWAYRTGRVPRHIADELPSVRIPPPAPRPVTDDAWRAALAAADTRVMLMLRLAAEAGLRRAEIAAVRVRDVVDSSGGPALIVKGKGGKTRTVPLSGELAALVRRGAAGHTPELAATGTGGYLFPAPGGGHLTPGHVGVLITRALPPGWSTHKLRHRFATRAYRGSRNLRATQVLLGHASIATTERYTAVDDDEIRAAAMAAVLEPD